MLKTFQRYSISTIYISIFIALLTWIVYFINPELIKVPDYYGLFNLNSLISQLPKRLIVSIAFFLFIIQAIALMNIVIKNDVLDKNSFIILLIYAVFGAMPITHSSVTVLIANFFVIKSLDIFLQMTNEKKSVKHSINAGTLLAIASIIYIPYLLLFFFGILTIIIIRSQISKEIIGFIFGFLIIFLFIFELLTLFDYIPQINNFLPLFNKEKISITTPEYIFILLNAIIFLFANLKIISDINKKEINKRTYFNIFFVLFLFTLIISILTLSKKSFSTLIIPVSVLFGNYFVEIKDTKTNNVILLIFIMSAFVFEIYRIIELF